MDRSQWYIGAPNGVVLCVDGSEKGQFTGRLYHAYSVEKVEVDGIGHLLSELEQFYDSINFPHVSTNERRFKKTGKAAGNTEREKKTEEKTVRSDEENVNTLNGNGKREKIMSDEELLKKHGDLGTFIIRVQQRQNSSWQGRITWMDRDETIYFRSVWEMIKLIASALDKVGGQEDSGDITWSEEPVEEK